MNEEQYLEDLRGQLSEINERLSNIYLSREEINAEAGKFEDLKEEMLEEINEYKCKTKCFYYKDPTKCKKQDKHRCPYLQHFELLSFIKKKA